jgi:hypothetical protein
MTMTPSGWHSSRSTVTPAASAALSARDASLSRQRTCARLPGFEIVIVFHRHLKMKLLSKNRFRGGKGLVKQNRRRSPGLENAVSSWPDNIVGRPLAGVREASAFRLVLFVLM